MRKRIIGAIALTALLSCKERPRGGNPSARGEGPQPPAVTAIAKAKAAESSAPKAVASADASAKVEAVTTAVPVAAGDVCRVARGPIQLSFTGPAALWVADDAAFEDDPHIVFNRDGVPRRVVLPKAAKRTDAAAATSSKAGAEKKPERLALTEAAERATQPGCSIAAGSIFCTDASGAIHRAPLAGEGDTIVAHARPGAPMAAARIAGTHAVYAFLADRKTSEGVVTVAFAALDDGPPVQLSEDGSGATFITLMPRGDEVVAMYIDARRALTPVHARVLTAAGKLALGPDAVLFVGEGTEGRTGAALVQAPGGVSYALLPIFKDAKSFGMAAIRIDQQPRDDAPVTWSLYPNGLEGAAIAAARTTTPSRVARVRPATSDPQAKRVLELGELDATGAFQALCTVGESSSYGDVSVLVDRFGTLWLTYTDDAGTWLERRGKKAG